jgi:hypothetical protein
MTGASQVGSLKSCQTRVWGASGQTLAGPTNPKHAKLLLLNQPSVQNQIKIQLQFSKPGSARLGSAHMAHFYIDFFQHPFISLTIPHFMLSFIHHSTIFILFSFLSQTFLSSFIFSCF